MESFTLYLDATGDSGWPPPFGRSQVNWYIYAGVALNTEADYAARIEIDKLLQKYISDPVKRMWPDTFYEIHFADIIFGKNLFSSLQSIQRKQLADEVIQLVIKLKPILFATAIDKLRLKNVYQSNAHDARHLGFRATIHRYSMYLNKKNCAGGVVIDEEEYRKDKELQSEIRDFRKFGVILRGWNYNPKYQDQIKRVLNTATFAPSESSPGIQLADVVARSTWMHFERGKSDRFKQLSGLWNRDGARIYDPSVVPKP